MRKVAGLILMSLVLTLPVPAAPVTGRVQIKGRSARSSVTTIVYAESLDGGRVQPGQFDLVQRDKAFLPRVLAVPVGSTVNFPNEDLIFHNVFSLSRPAPFDLGLYRAGTSKSRIFSAPATYRVFCNIHPQMAATIVVAPTSYITETDANGNYRLDLPPGRYRITAWSERSEPASVEITVGSTIPDAVLDESRFIEIHHKNKFGLDYPKK